MAMRRSSRKITPVQQFTIDPEFEEERMDDSVLESLREAGEAGTTFTPSGRRRSTRARKTPNSSIDSNDSNVENRRSNRTPRRKAAAKQISYIEPDSDDLDFDRSSDEYEDDSEDQEEHYQPAVEDDDENMEVGDYQEAEDDGNEHEIDIENDGYVGEEGFQLIKQQEQIFVDDKDVFLNLEENYDDDNNNASSKSSSMEVEPTKIEKRGTSGKEERKQVEESEMDDEKDEEEEEEEEEEDEEEEEEKEEERPSTPPQEFDEQGNPKLRCSMCKGFDWPFENVMKCKMCRVPVHNTCAYGSFHGLGSVWCPDCRELRKKCKYCDKNNKTALFSCSDCGAKYHWRCAGFEKCPDRRSLCPQCAAVPEEEREDKTDSVVTQEMLDTRKRIIAEIEEKKRQEEAKDMKIMCPVDEDGKPVLGGTWSSQLSNNERSRWTKSINNVLKFNETLNDQVMELGVKRFDPYTQVNHVKNTYDYRRHGLVILEYPKPPEYFVDPKARVKLGFNPVHTNTQALHDSLVNYSARLGNPILDNKHDGMVIPSPAFNLGTPPYSFNQPAVDAMVIPNPFPTIYRLPGTTSKERKRAEKKQEEMQSLFMLLRQAQIDRLPRDARHSVL